MQELYRSGYNPSAYYQNNPSLKRVIDSLRAGIADVQFGEIADSLVTGGDTYMCLADFDSYKAAQAKINDAYRDTERWNRMSLVNIAKAGFFASDRAVKEYADRIWQLKTIV